jgi:nucleotide-binding universal stress UspA family protein
MATATISSRSFTSAGLQCELTSPARAQLLVATDASPAADAAIRAAQAIASRTGQSVKMLAVHVPLPMVAAEVQLSVTPDMEAENRDSLRQQVVAQRERLEIRAPWPLDVVSGDPAATIVSVSQGIGASLIIMGLGGHGVFDRFLGDETVLKVLRLGSIPVLAVAPNFTGLPTRVLAAMDFSASSVRALALGAKLLQKGGKVTLAHVVSRDLDPANWTNPAAAYSGTVGRALDRVVAEVGFDDAVVDRRVLAGDPAKELLHLSDAVQPDLIVAGSHGLNFLTRLLLGSVSARLVRSADCSVLVAPPEDAPSFLEELPKSFSVFGFYEWTERLEEFTRRNVGRLATLEIIDPEIGAQVQEKHVPFLGASYDPRDAQMHIMFGRNTRGQGHLTHSIVGVTAIQSLHDRVGRDRLLRVAHGRGQTLVTLER